MKSFHRILTILSAFVVAVACDNGLEDGLQLNNDLEFTVGTPVVNGAAVTVQINHNGADTDPWYCFVSEDKTSKEFEVISNKINEALSSGSKLALRKSKSRSVSFNNLQPYTEYRGFVFGLTEEGVIYGKIATFTFTTQADADAVYETKDFTIKYLGRQEDEATGFVAETFQIDNPNKKRYYFTTFNNYYLQYYTVEDIVKGEIEYIKENIAPYYKLDQYSVADETVVLQAPEGRQQSGEYTAIAIELDSKGAATRYYGAQTYTVVEEEAEAAYTKWLGTWELSDANNVRQTVTFEHADNNFFVYVKNWEAGDGYDKRPFGEDYPFSVFQFPAYYQDENLYFENTSLREVTFPESVPGYFGIYGTATYDGATIPVCVDGDTFAYAALKSDNEAEIRGMRTGLEGMNFTYESMGYVGFWYTDGGQSYEATGWYEPMVFPINMVKKSGPSASSVNVKTMPEEVQMTRFIRAN